jgi:V/A-type H+-transporting ATPase subunit D
MKQEVSPTRMELIRIKQRVALAKKGHKLLKQKRDALIMEFFRVMKQAKDIRNELNKAIREAYFTLSIAKSLHNILEIESVAFANKKEVLADIKAKNVMGVKVPLIDAEIEGSSYPFQQYSLIGISYALEKSIQNYEKVLKLTVELAGSEIAMKRLIKEIEKTKRRVNSLEHILIPMLEHQMKEIAMRLDEMERDAFVALKTIKRKLAKKQM